MVCNLYSLKPHPQFLQHHFLIPLNAANFRRYYSHFYIFRHFNLISNNTLEGTIKFASPFTTQNPPAPKRGKRIYYFSQPKAFLSQNAALNISTISSLVSGTKEPFEPSHAFCAIISKFLSSVIPTALRFEGIPIVSKKNFFRASIPA